MTVRPDAPATYRLVRRLAVLFAVGCAELAVFLFSPSPEFAAPAVAAARTSGIGGALLGSLLIGLAGLAGTAIVQRARARADGAPGRAARVPQAIVVPAIAALAAAAALSPRDAALAGPAAPSLLFALGGGAIVAAFLLLVAERTVAARGAGRGAGPLAEADALAALLFVPVVVWPAGGCLAIASGLGLPYVAAAASVLAGFVVLVAGELAVRASANWFLPPAAPDHARAAVDSLAARLVRPATLAPGGVAAPLRDHFGIDFSRSWALAYMRAAAAPVALGLLLVCWGLSGVGLVGMDERGINERFGAPVAVLAPGIHLTLPWPLGRIRRVEYGVIHSTPLGEATRASVQAEPSAEDAPPASADRLWEEVHPSEVTFLIASRSAGVESFQSVSADIRIVWRVGLSDRDAIQAAYALEDPDAFVRASAGRLVDGFLAGQTLDAVLGGGREAVAERLRAALQRTLDGVDGGIDVLAVVIEAAHPPAGAADAYHQVQAAEIMSREGVSVARGQAIATAKRARMQATDLTTQAQGVAADTVGAAEVGGRAFAADQAAAAAGGRAFLLERYFGNLAAALPKAPLVIVDHRLAAPDGPVLDLRSLANPGRAATADED